MPKIHEKKSKYIDHTFSNIPFDRFCVDNSLVNKEIICKNWLSTEQLEQMKSIDYKVDNFQHRIPDYEPKLLISFKKLPVTHKFAKRYTWPMRTYKNEICTTKTWENISALSDCNFFVKGCKTSNDNSKNNSLPTNMSDIDNIFFVKIDQKHDEKDENNVFISTLELEKNTKYIAPINIIKPNGQKNDVSTGENILEEHFIGNTSQKIHSVNLTKEEKIKSNQEKYVTKHTGNSIKNNVRINQDNLTQDVEENNYIKSHNVQEQENLQVSSKESKEENIERKYCLSVCKNNDAKEIPCNVIYKNNNIEEIYNKTNNKSNSVEDMSHLKKFKNDSIEEMKHEKDDQCEDRKESYNKNSYKKGIAEKYKAIEESNKECKEHCKKECNEEINHGVSEYSRNLIQNETKHMNRADNIVEHNAELHFTNKEESLFENEIKKDINNECKNESQAEYLQKYQEEKAFEIREEFRYKNKEKSKKIQNKKDQKTHKLHIDQFKLSKTKSIEKLIESKNDIDFEEDIQQQYSCVCTNEEMKNKLKYCSTMDIIKSYKNMQTPYKRFINIYIEQNFYTEIYLDMSDNNLETLKPCLEKVIAVPNCKQMNKYSEYIQHILSDMKNHYIIYNEKLFDLGRILILYACLNQNVNLDKDYELNIKYCCTYIGHDIDIYITFIRKQFYDSDQYAHQSEKKYKYGFLLPKDECTDIKTEKKPKNKFKKLFLKPFRSNKRNKK
ncbi:hypothetical protein COBT_000108 [Conglomerata obtusa]